MTFSLSAMETEGEERRVGQEEPEEKVRLTFTQIPAPGRNKVGGRLGVPS